MTRLVRLSRYGLVVAVVGDMMNRRCGLRFFMGIGSQKAIWGLCSLFAGIILGHTF